MAGSKADHRTGRHPGRAQTTRAGATRGAAARDGAAGPGAAPVPERDAEQWVVVGRIGAPHGVRGWLRVQSDTDPPDGLLELGPWWLRGAPAAGAGWSKLAPEQMAHSGRHLVAKLPGVDDRDAAAALTGRELAVLRSSLPEPEDAQYYWCDLIGMRVTTESGEALGEVLRLFETGANDVMVVGREQHLVPFVPDAVVKNVDLAAGVITVDWDVEY